MAPVFLMFACTHTQDNVHGMSLTAHSGHNGTTTTACTCACTDELPVATPPPSYLFKAMPYLKTHIPASLSIIPAHKQLTSPAPPSILAAVQAQPHPHLPLQAIPHGPLTHHR